MKKDIEQAPSSSYSKPKFLITFLIVMGFFAAAKHGFSIEVPIHKATFESTNNSSEQTVKVEPEQEVFIEELDDFDEPTPITNNESDDTETTKIDDTETAIDSCTTAIDDDTTSTDSSRASKNSRIKGVWSYDKCFPDINDVQLQAAMEHGISPISTRKEAEEYIKNYKLVNVEHSPFYVVDDLTHSIPYLVPRAQQLLNTICMNFIDSCQVKGIPLHLPIVTSFLRTANDVSRLQRGNKNATTNSCHCYGTTVDIAYSKFYPVTDSFDPKQSLTRWDEPMKKILSEVLNDLRLQGKCYVKYERKQGCFHLTCR